MGTNTNETERVYRQLKKARDKMTGTDLERNAQDGTIAAKLHAHYNIVGMKEGWLKKEYATPLSEQSDVNKQKNVAATVDVLDFWIAEFDGAESDIVRDGIVADMKKAMVYGLNKGNPRLEAASDAQHEQWKAFVSKYQAERVTPGSDGFREANYNEFITPYKDLEDSTKDKDRLVVAVTTYNVLLDANVTI